MSFDKNYTSFSEISDYLDCSYRHKLKYVDKIDLNEDTLYITFGKIIHDAIREYLITKKMPFSNELIKRFIKETDQNIKEEDKSEFVDNLPDMVSQIPNWLNLTFPGWETIFAEKQIYEPVKEQKGFFFKGYIDAIIKVPVIKTKKQLNEEKRIGKEFPIEYEYWILDWKTCTKFWPPLIRRDYKKQLQLILYKYFYCQLSGINPEQIRCGFVLIRRNLPKSNDKRIDFVKVSVGPKTFEKGYRTLNNSINLIGKGLNFKNRSACKFCSYYNTIYCK